MWILSGPSNPAILKKLLTHLNQVYQVKSESYISHDQFYGRSLGKETIKTGLAQFFHNGVELRKDAVSLSICKIRDILRWFMGQKQLHFYASSLLFVYEGSPHLANGTKWREDAQTGQEHGQGEPKCNNYIHLANCKLRSHFYGLASQRSAYAWLNCSDLPQDIHHMRQKNGIWPHSQHYHLEQANGNGVSSEEDTKKMRVVEGKSIGLGKGRWRDEIGEMVEDVE
ncbi:hypothetical protein NFI96_028448, partial [Prochilodus magdalenae]